MLEQIMQQWRRRADGFPDVPYEAGATSWVCVHCLGTMNGAVTRYLGARQCRFHPGERDFMHGNGEYTCCGFSPVLLKTSRPTVQRTARAIDRGCTHADHVPQVLWDAAIDRCLVIPHVIATKDACAHIPRLDATARTRLQERWTGENAAVVELVQKYARCSPVFHATLLPATVDAVRVTATARIRYREQSAKMRDDISWLPHQPLPEADKVLPTAAQVAALRNGYLAELLVAPPSLHTIGSPVGSLGAVEIEMGNVLEMRAVHVPLTLVQIADEGPLPANRISGL
jgi:hypothetical protein